MTLSAPQQQELRELVSQGRSLSEIQSALQAYGVQLTYMELRLLIDDLNLTVAEKTSQKTVPPMPEKSTAPDAPIDGESFKDEEMPPSGGVSVSIDSVVRPGTVMSGTATFTDGVTVQWSLDQYGRLGLYSAPKGYQPNPADLQEFQQKLRNLLESRGGL